MEQILRKISKFPEILGELSMRKQCVPGSFSSTHALEPTVVLALMGRYGSRIPSEEEYHCRISERGGASQHHTWHTAPPVSHGSPLQPLDLAQTGHLGTAKNGALLDQTVARSCSLPL